MRRRPQHFHKKKACYHLSTDFLAGGTLYGDPGGIIHTGKNGVYTG
jgi:hypothetical protein